MKRIQSSKVGGVNFNTARGSNASISQTGNQGLSTHRGSMSSIKSV